MNPLQLRALEHSICHWNNICMGFEASNGAQGCALCQVFGPSKCRECPVKERFPDGCDDIGWRQFVLMHHPEKTFAATTPSLSRSRAIDVAERVLCNLVWLLPLGHKWAEPEETNNA